MDPAVAVGASSGEAGAEPAADDTSPRGDGDGGPPNLLERIPRRRLIAGIVAVVTLPLVVALIALHSPRWYPLLDWAQTEIRVRDVWSSNPPLIGLAGRIGPFNANGGSHPGPISFYALWPVWTLLGRSSFGLVAGNVVLDIAAVTLAIWMAYRRGGAALALAVGALMAVLMRAYGAFMLTSPWNPYLPVLWWFVFLLAVWSVFSDDWPMLVVAVLAGTFAMQTHISYLGLVAGLGAVAIAVIAYRLLRGRLEPSSRRSLWKWAVIAFVLFAVLWTPPVIDEIAHGHGSCKTPGVTSCGNLTVIREHFSDPPDPAIGPSTGLDVFLTQINPVKLFTEPLVENGQNRPVSGTRLPGALLLVVWAGSVALAWRLRERALLRLDAVLGVAVVLGYISAVRIFGEVWFYLLLWAWGIAALLLFTIGWTIVAYIRSRTVEDDPRRARLARGGIITLVAVIVVATVVFAVDGARTDVMQPRLNAEMHAITAPTVAALAQARREGQQGPYLVSWLPEPQAIGGEGYSLLNELLRQGFDADGPFIMRPGATRYHVVPDGQAKLQIHLATGADIECWRRNPQYHEVAYNDPRTPAERQEFDALHARVLEDLVRANMADVAPQVDTNLFMLSLVPKIPAATRQEMTRMLALALPVAVFIGPVGDPPRDAAGRCL